MALINVKKASKVVEVPTRFVTKAGKRIYETVSKTGKRVFFTNTKAGNKNYAPKAKATRAGNNKVRQLHSKKRIPNKLRPAAQLD